VNAVQTVTVQIAVPEKKIADVEIVGFWSWG